MSWLDKPISGRGDVLVCSGMIGAAAWMLGAHVGMAVLEAIIFGFLIGGGTFGIAESIIRRLK
jgi:hypothetical protein